MHCLEVKLEYRLLKLNPQKFHIFISTSFFSAVKVVVAKKNKQPIQLSGADLG